MKVLIAGCKKKKQNGYWKKFLKQKYHFKILPWILILSPKLISLLLQKNIWINSPAIKK